MEYSSKHIELNTEIIKQLRNVVNDCINYTFNKTHIINTNKKKVTIESWNTICTIMDRIEDIVTYLNSLELGTKQFIRSAFDFYNFMDQAMVLIECIDKLAEIFDTDISGDNNKTNIFGDVNHNGGTDGSYFKYLRSLCSIHPMLTNHFIGKYQEDNGECCPYVMWNDGTTPHKGDLIAIIYDNKNTTTTKIITIDINQIFQYVTYRYILLEKVISKIKKDDDERKKSLSEIKLKTPDEFTNYLDYLKYLKSKKEERYSSIKDYELDIIIKIFSITITNPNNINSYHKYCNAIKYAVSIEHERIQTMNLQINDFELYHILSPSNESKAYTDNIYEIQKLEDLIITDNENAISKSKAELEKMWLKNKKNYFEQYVTIDDDINYFELYVLMKINLYFDCLNNDCFLNKAIPVEIQYRNMLN